MMTHTSPQLIPEATLSYRFDNFSPQIKEMIISKLHFLKILHVRLASHPCKFHCSSESESQAFADRLVSSTQARLQRVFNAALRL